MKSQADHQEGRHGNVRGGDDVDGARDPGEVPDVTAGMNKLLERFGDTEAIKLITQADGECNNIGSDFVERDLDIALDSGAVSHVCSDDHTACFDPKRNA